MDNKRSLLELFGKHRVELKSSEEEHTGPRDDADTTERAENPGNVEIPVADRIDSDKPISYQPMNSREAARNMLKNFRNNSKQTQMLDGMGYGDIAAMIQHLGPLGRRELRNILKNRAEEPGIDINDLEHVKEEINGLKDFMLHYDEKTPKEIEEFENRMQGLKYAALLQDANRGFIKRTFNRFFNRKDERVNYARQILTEYGDTKVKRTNQRFEFLNKLREGVGKPISQQTLENARGNRDSRNQLEQRNVPEGR